MLAIVEGTDKLDNNAIAFVCSDDEFRSIEASLYQSPSQVDSEPTEDSTANKRTERIRSMACNSEEIRSEQHVRQKFSTCSVDQ